MIVLEAQKQKTNKPVAKKRLRKNEEAKTSLQKPPEKHKIHLSSSKSFEEDFCTICMKLMQVRLNELNSIACNV